VLDDPKRAIPPYDAIVLLAPKRAGDEKLKARCSRCSQDRHIRMREANLRAAGNDASSSSDAVVARWLWRQAAKRSGHSGRFFHRTAAVRPIP